jgi:hypothetical protein
MRHLSHNRSNASPYFNLLSKSVARPTPGMATIFRLVASISTYRRGQPLCFRWRGSENKQLLRLVGHESPGWSIKRMTAGNARDVAGSLIGRRPPEQAVKLLVPSSFEGMRALGIDELPRYDMYRLGVLRLNS